MTRELQAATCIIPSGRRRRRKSFLLIMCGSALLVSGCAFRRHVANMAIEHNDFVAQTTNRQTVLNILRAREREPMHFTSFANVAGKVQGQGQVGLNTTLNGDNGQTVTTNFEKETRGADGAFSVAETTRQVATTVARGATNYVPSGQVSVTTGTDFQVAVNASEEFYRGILGPLSSGIIVHYLRQGFSPDLLSHLVIRRLDFRANVVDAAGKTIRTAELGNFINSPDDAEKLIDFAAVLKCWQLGTVMKETDAVRVAAPAISDLSGVSADVLARIKRVKDPDGVYRFYLEVSPSRSEPVLAMVETGWSECDKRDLFESTVKGLASGLPTVSKSSPAPEERTPGNESASGTGEGRMSIVASAEEDPVSIAGEQPISQGVGPTGVLTLSSQNEGLSRLLPTGYKAVIEIDITLRSAEGILYYLGEYVRPRSERAMLRHPEAKCENKATRFCLPIIQVLPASEVDSSNRFIDVIYRGRRWAVPMAGHALTEKSGRSSQTISLVQQLLNLHRSSKDLPFTPLVRVQN